MYIQDHRLPAPPKGRKVPAPVDGFPAFPVGKFYVTGKRAGNRLQEMPRLTWPLRRDGATPNRDAVRPAQAHPPMTLLRKTLGAAEAEALRRRGPQEESVAILGPSQPQKQTEGRRK